MSNSARLRQHAIDYHDFRTTSMLDSADLAHWHHVDHAVLRTHPIEDLLVLPEDQRPMPSRAAVLVKGLQKAVEGDVVWVDANIIRLLLDRYENPKPP